MLPHPSPARAATEGPKHSARFIAEIHSRGPRNRPAVRPTHSAPGRITRDTHPGDVTSRALASGSHDQGRWRGGMRQTRAESGCSRRSLRSFVASQLDERNGDIWITPIVASRRWPHDCIRAGWPPEGPPSALAQRHGATLRWAAYAMPIGDRRIVAPAQTAVASRRRRVGVPHFQADDPREPGCRPQYFRTSRACNIASRPVGKSHATAMVVCPRESSRSRW